MELKLKNWSTQISPFLSATSNKHQATHTELERARVCVSRTKKKKKKIIILKTKQYRALVLYNTAPLVYHQQFSFPLWGEDRKKLL